MAGELLAEAERAGARVTVLAVGTWLEQYPQMARRILAGGHDLGNHTLHHLDIAAMGGSGAYAEIAGCALRLRALTGSTGRWLRPSQNALRDSADRAGGPQGRLPDMRVL
jgi:peptidoglycan/xylan/chitin deacetylase (PgdA/CDA1 family)